MGKKNAQKSNGKKRELNKSERIEAKKAKQAEKSLKKVNKHQDEEDIEAILQEFMQKDAQKFEITIEVVQQPSPRGNFTMTMLPNGEIMVFGGEYFDGDVNVCYNELYRWNLDSNQWRYISSPNTPPPRCSHQAAIFRDHLYIFGGEFATTDQFHHYRDMWKINLKTNAWEQMDEKGGPSARSGHRMVLWRNYLVVFGGFYEAARETKWYNDLYLFNLVDFKWKKVTYSIHKSVPTPRSGCQLAVHPSKDIIFMYGGFAKVKEVGVKSQGKVFSDLWALQMSPVLKKQDPTWEKLSKKGHAPSPRSGATLAVHKQRFILFGGVHDEEQHRHTIQSTFFNDLFVYDMDRRRWFEFQLRQKKAKDTKKRRKQKTLIADPETCENDSDAGSDEDDFERMLEEQFGYVDEEGNIVYIENSEDEEEKSAERDPQHNLLDEAKEEEAISLASEALASSTDDGEGAEETIPDPVEARKPCPRINPALFIRGSTMFVYGGMVEDGDREITLDDCWSLDLKRLDEWKEILPGTVSEQIWKGTTSETEDSFDEEDSDDDEDQGSGNDMDHAVDVLTSQSKDLTLDENAPDVNAKKSHAKKDRKAIRAEMEKLQEQLDLDDRDRTPQLGENLREFFARTCSYWTTQIANLPDAVERQLSVKEMKREGFDRAEIRYNELQSVLERLNELELQQKEAEECQQQKKKTKLRRS
uniref:Uncharacterized protein AlNc14C274G10016 n=1 Tax=Albugo laibachii Nc14 TaxID=890382 RepID=F0WUK8_9STRA|nr:conserved hypothetical protein [Albugo laibachii Nc14]|eukprot:CCA25089.1 conserved hypothetical protein [Albugo laibachii Nc14]